MPTNPTSLLQQFGQGAFHRTDADLDPTDRAPAPGSDMGGGALWSMLNYQGNDAAPGDPTSPNYRPFSGTDLSPLMSGQPGALGSFLQANQPFQQGQGMLLPAGAPDSQGAPRPAPAAPPTPAPIARRGGSGGAGGPSAPAGPSVRDQFLKAGAASADADTAAQLDLQNAQAQHTSDQAMAEFNGTAEGIARRKAVEDAAAARLADYERANTELENMAPDPNRLWTRMDAGQKIQGSLMQVLHGFTDGFNGTQTAGPLDKAMDRDLLAQKYAYDAKKEGLSGRLTLYKMYRDQGLSDAEATTQAKMQMIKASGNYLDPVLQGAQNQVVIRNGQRIKEGLAGQYAQLQAQAQKQADEHGKSQAETSKLWAETGQIRDEAAQKKMLQQQGLLPPELSKRAIFFNDRPPMIMADAESAQSLRPMVASANSIRRDIQEAKELARQWGSSSDKTKAGAAYKVKVDGIIKNINQAEGIKQALQSDNMKMYLDTLHNGALTPSSATAGALDAIDGTVQGTVNDALTASGGRSIFAQPTASAKPGVL